MTLQQIIQRYRQNSGLSYEAIARQLDVSRSTVCRWASGEIRTVQSETKQRLSALIRHDVDALLEQEARFLEKPVLGTIKAGYDMFADQQLLGYEPVSEQEAASGDFFLKVRGNSMINAGIRDGDLLFVRACSQVQSGEIAVVLISDEEATVKKVILKDDLMVLEAANPEVENRYFTRNEVRAAGAHHRQGSLQQDVFLISLFSRRMPS